MSFATFAVAINGKGWCGGVVAHTALHTARLPPPLYDGLWRTCVGRRDARGCIGRQSAEAKLGCVGHGMSSHDGAIDR